MVITRGNSPITQTPVSQSQTLTTQSSTGINTSTTTTTPILSTSSSQSLNSVSSSQIYKLKLPSFWSTCPEAWFIQAEMQFLLHNVDDDNIKFQLVIISLSQDIITKVLDVVQNPPSIRKYESIKKALCERFSLSEESRIEKLFSDTSIGDRKPSELFHDMCSLAGTNTLIGRELLYKLWLRQLPQQLQLHLTSTNLSSIDDKMTLADKIYEVSTRSQVASLTSNNTNSNVELLVQNLAELTTTICQNLNKLTLEVSELRSRSRERSRERSNSKKRFYPNTQQSRHQPISTQKSFCWYHEKYGPNAKFCTQPCNYSDKNLQNSSNQNLN